ncbi:glycosyltransferase [Lichenicoccus sp.]|uniref:glycosyltransferase n=1 Tax=Lichenicoccus sp. TaxID=2781899 RepID=UPI003D0C1124
MAQPDQGPLADLVAPGLAPWFRRPTRLDADSAWYGHLPFAHWIVRALRPLLLVELGTHAGVSYAGFCDAVLAEGLPTRCFAIDGWTGDEHAGFYGEDVFTDLARFHAQHYGGFSRLLRCLFDEARDDFPDGSIDLLHIDGRHRLEDVAHDFAHWRPKLSDRAVVLLHDTNVREGDFGVWRFWEQQRRQHPSFEFLHAHGLGVLAVGAQVPAAVLDLCAASGSHDAALLRERFALLGERWEVEYALAMCERRHATTLREVAAAHDAALGALGERLQQADQFLRSQSVAFGLQRSALADAKAARHAAELAAGREREAAAERLEMVRRELAAERDEALAEWDVAVAERDVARFALEAAQVERDAARRECHAALQAAEQHRGEVGIIRGSLSWRLTGPVRRVLDAIRPQGPGPALAGPAAAPDDLPAAFEDGLPPEAPPDLPVPEPQDREPQETTLAEPARPPFRVIGHVLFVVGEPGTPGATYRCRRNAAAMRDAGYTADVVDLFDVDPAILARADLLVVWRAAMSPHIETMFRLARAAGTRIAFDVDDLMTRPELARIEIIDGIRTIGTTEVATQSYFEGMLRTMQAADLCLTTTAELAVELRRQCDVVHVLPNVFEAATERRARYALRRRQEAGDDGHVRLGYAGGTRTHQRDFAQVAPALARVLAARPHAVLVLFREAANRRGLLQMEEFPELAGLADRIEWRDMVALDSLPDELVRFDISLCPLETGNVFCEAKSELKYFEAALAGACTVASPTGPYRRAIEDGVTGFLASDDAAWEAALLRLVDDPVLRRATARRAYHDVLWRFGPWRQAALAATLIGGFSPAGAGDAEVARCIELGLRRGDYLARGVPEVPESELLFAHDTLGEAEVTVVMTSYNYEAHVLAALDSVRAQTLGILDLAVVDDGSTDQSVPLVLEWARRHRDRFNRIRILRTVHNAGLGGARNVVCDAAETPWLMALDSDNRLLPEACATLLAAVRGSPRAAFAYPRIRQFGDSDAIMGEHAFEPRRLQIGNYIDAMALVAKWAWAAAGGYYVRRDAMGWEDYDLWLNLVELGQFGVAVPEVLAEYRVHGSSMVNAITEQSANKQAMVAFVEARHPWLRLRMRAARKRVA